MSERSPVRIIGPDFKWITLDMNLLLDFAVLKNRK